MNLKWCSQEFQSAIYFSNGSGNGKVSLRNMKTDELTQLSAHNWLQFLDCQYL